MTDWVIPCLLAGVAAAAMGRRTDVYGALTDGAAEGLRVLGRILPTLVVLLSALLQKFEQRLRRSDKR